MKLEKTIKYDYAVLKIIGAVKSGMEFDLADGFDFLLKDNSVSKLIVDLSETPFVNSAALGIFLNIHKYLEQANGKLCFCAISADVRNMFEITKLNCIVVVAADYDEAVAYILAG